jgi:hypothetical protein
MLRRRWKRSLAFWRVALVLAVLAAVLAIGTSMFVRSLYTYSPGHFEPKDFQRGYHLEEGGEADTRSERQQSVQGRELKMRGQ